MEHFWVLAVAAAVFASTASFISGDRVEGILYLILAKMWLDD